MADDQEKTEEPTPKKIEDARKDGNVPKSQDTAGIFTLFMAILGFLMLFPFIAERAENLVKYYFSLQGTSLDENTLMSIAITTFKEFLIIVLPLSIVAAIAGILGNLAQIGILFTTKPLVPDLTKLDPIKGAKNLFSLKKLLEGMMMTFKASTAMGVGFFFFFTFTKELPTVALFGLNDQLEWVRDKVIILALIMLFILFVFAMIDLVIKRKQYFDQLKMSKQEIKDEMKNMEGDPHIKAKIRQVQMQAAQKRMMAEVPNADVVITNPTHYAVAIKYDESKHHAPMVIAKGKDNIAVQIKKVARENNVHIVQNPPLARSLYAEVDVDKPIPETLFAAVAEVLAYVYKMNNKR
ncbi:MAG: flagellar biosynthesis protein FlhB [Campylobacterota bacterium]|nr:flagellar biosynthesis protein FlhB [Campylobacterota bacterium]